MCACAYRARIGVRVGVCSRARGMKRDSVAEEGKERAAGERLGFGLRGFGFGCLPSLPLSLPLTHSLSLSLLFSAPARIRHPLTSPSSPRYPRRPSAYDVRDGRGSILRRGCREGARASVARAYAEAGVDLRKGIPYANLFPVTPSASPLVFLDKVHTARS